MQFAARKRYFSTVDLCCVVCTIVVAMGTHSGATWWPAVSGEGEDERE